MGAAVVTSQRFRVDIIPFAICSAGVLAILGSMFRPGAAGPVKAVTVVVPLLVLAVAWAYYFLTDVQANSGGVTTRVWGMRSHVAWSDVDRCEADGRTLYLVPTTSARRDNPRIAQLCSYLNTERIIIGRGYRNVAQIAAELERWRVRATSEDSVG